MSMGVNGCGVKLIAGSFAVFLALGILPGGAQAGTWQRIGGAYAPFYPSTALQLTDGRVIAQDSANYKDWWVLSPDAQGSYAKGTWTQVKSLPVIGKTQYAPLYYGSAVLLDGKLVIVGGEDNGGKQVDTNLGAIYDPQANTWTSIPPPNGGRYPWSVGDVGDVETVVLPDGTLLIANTQSPEVARFNEAKLTWNILPGPNKSDGGDEEGWTLLPDGSVLTVDTFVFGLMGHLSELYFNGGWYSAGDTKVRLEGGVDPKTGKDANEMGPQVLRPNGSVVAFGASGHTATYWRSGNPTQAGTWEPGPDFPIVGGVQLNSADGPAAILPDGTILVAGGPGYTKKPATFYEYDGTKFTPEPSTLNSKNTSTFSGRMLVLPTGQILYTDGSNDAEIYTATGTSTASWAPTITSFPSKITNKTAYSITGTQFNGLTQGAAYGDDAQMATNFPLVRVTSGKNVYYCRTYGHSTMAVATEKEPVSTHFVCTNIPKGAATLQVVANGIPSAAVKVAIQ
jgi:Kelch motif